MLHGLEQVHRKKIEYRGSTFTEMDVDAALRRAPKVGPGRRAVAHTNVPGSRDTKRRQDVEELLAAGSETVMLTSRRGGGPRPPAAVSTVGLRKSYGDKTVLDGIDLCIPAGSVFALRGPNGSARPPP